MINKLFPYQLEDAKILAGKKRFGLWHTPGVGKTYISLGAAKIAGLRTIGVFCPKSMIGTWQNELLQWGFTGYVKNYEQLISKKFSHEPTDAVIADECQYIKDWNAQRTKQFYLTVAKHCPRVWFLSGTPAPRSNADLHVLLSFLQPKLHGKLKEFTDNYCYYKSFKRNGRVIEVPYGYRNTERINAILKEVGIRRTKEEVLPDLPDIMYKNIYLPADKKIIAECLDIPVNEIRQAMESGGQIPAHLASIVRAIGLSKVDSTVEFVQNLGAPCLIFALHREVIDNLVKDLDGLKVAKIDGSVSADVRTKLVAQFQAGHLDVLVLQTHAAGTGLTLTRASHVVHCERPWSASAYEQATARAHRIGQKNALTVYDMVSPNTIDTAIGAILEEKRIGMAAIMAA